MSAQIYNTASLTFEYGTQKGCVSSNTAVTTLQEILSISQISLGEDYFIGTEITFVITADNNSALPVKNVKISTNLGTYPLNQNNLCDNLLIPLTYESPSILYIGGNFFSKVEPKIQPGKITFTVPCIPAKSSAMILYKAKINEFALISAGSEIMNTATLTSRVLTAPISSECLITAKNKADVRIIKSMNPNPILSGEKITYTFTLYNYGNIKADNVVLSDVFSPAPTDIALEFNGENVDFKNYLYLNGTLTFPSYSSEMRISVPEANFVQDSVTGMVAVEPGVALITATGQI